MASFTSFHYAELVNQFWNSGKAVCPHDALPLHSYFHSHKTGYLLVLACAYCGKKAQVTRFSDPRSGQFRPWTSTEKKALLAAHFDGIPADCPVCGARIKSSIHPDRHWQVVECQRCGNAHAANPLCNSENLLKLA